jgi:beta-barrel assembly-enhancing protease
MKNKTLGKALFAAVALGSFGVSALLVHVGCQSGSGGGDFGKTLANVGGQIGSAVTGRQEVGKAVTAVANYAEKIRIGPEDEDAMGQSVALSLTNTSPLTKNEKLNKYVSLVGLTLVEASPRPVGNWMFGVLESNQVNAFAGPNGYIFVTTGALKLMKDESELAGVLAHELTHVLHHHGLNGIKSDANSDALKDAASIAVSATGSDRYGVFNKLADPLVDGVLKKPYARTQELDADRNAITITVAAGYDPNGLIRFLERMGNTPGDVMSTHPGSAERLSSARAQIAKLGNPKGKTLKERFEKNVDLR